MTKERALQLARAELQRRNIVVQSGWRMIAFPDTHIFEVPPYEIPYYAVSVYDPTRSSKIALYVIRFESDGTVDLMETDLPKQHSERRDRSNQTLQPTAIRFVFTFLMIRTIQEFATLAPTSRG
jgi:hypothetical protein